MTCLGNSIVLCDLWVKLHKTVLLFFTKVHLPSLVQIGGLGSLLTSVGGGYKTVALVSKSLEFGNLLKPMMGFYLNIDPQSMLFIIMSQFLWIIFLIFRLHGLKLVTMIGVLISVFCITSKNSSWVNLNSLL